NENLRLRFLISKAIDEDVRVERVLQALRRPPEDIVDATASPNGSESSCKLFTECHEVERLVDRLGFGLHAQCAPGDVKLSLIHVHVFSNPARSRATSAMARGRHCAFRPPCNCFGHLILRLYTLCQ